MLPFCRWECWGSESLSNLPKDIQLANVESWTLHCLPRKRTSEVPRENLSPILESPYLKPLCILPVLICRHYLETYHQPLLRGVRRSILMDCISKIRSPAISQSLMERDLIEKGGACLCFKHTWHPHLVHSSCHVLLAGMVQVPIQKSPPQRGLWSALHHTLPLALL